MPYKEPPIEHQFKPGQSGNLEGKPKGTLSMTTLLREYLETKDLKTGKYVKDIVNEAFVKRAVSKSDVLMKELLDRTDGKVTQSIDLDDNIDVRNTYNFIFSPEVQSRVHDINEDIKKILIQEHIPKN